MAAPLGGRVHVPAQGQAATPCEFKAALQGGLFAPLALGVAAGQGFGGQSGSNRPPPPFCSKRARKAALDHPAWSLGRPALGQGHLSRVGAQQGRRQFRVTKRAARAACLNIEGHLDKAGFIAQDHAEPSRRSQRELFGIDLETSLPTTLWRRCRGPAGGGPPAGEHAALTGYPRGSSNARCPRALARPAVDAWLAITSLNWMPS